ncbi:MAG TPA: DinB family protein [Terracidiphilus sp.]|jgi:uncharacterized damage-inducible protein DinB|nr:DinB family protein [Terracidiphilus sp.]
MTTGAAITFEELLAWSDEAALKWKSHIEANPAVLELPCSINRTATVQGLVRHIWGVELRWGGRLTGLPESEFPEGPLDALFAMHVAAMGLYRTLLAEPAARWDDTYVLKADWLPVEKRTVSRRKVAAHSLLHSQRHYAQLATLVREAGYPLGSEGDLLLSAALF